MYEKSKAKGIWILINYKRWVTVESKYLELNKDRIDINQSNKVYAGEFIIEHEFEMPIRLLSLEL